MLHRLLRWRRAKRFDTRLAAGLPADLDVRLRDRADHIAAFKVALTFDGTSFANTMRRVQIALGEIQSSSRYRQCIAAERTLGLAHVRNTARRIRAELGLEEGATRG